MLPETSDSDFMPADQLTAHSGVVVDIRTPEAFSECHLPDSVNHCVYEVSFTDAFPKAYPDKNTPIVIYGDGEPYKADVAALGRLRTLGYNNVAILAGGLNKWHASGGETVGPGPAPAISLEGRLALDTNKTRIRWTGRNLTNQHYGEVEAARGFMELNAAGIPVRGEVVADLRQMTCHDIQDAGLAAALIGHLSNADFFDVTHFPEASFKLERVTPIVEATYGQPNFTVEGTMEARGNEIPLCLNAMIEPIENGYVFQSNFNFDRVALGACYGSGRLFERLGMHLVNDLVSIDVVAFFNR